MVSHENDWPRSAAVVDFSQPTPHAANDPEWHSIGAHFWAFRQRSTASFRDRGNAAHRKAAPRKAPDREAFSASAPSAPVSSTRQKLPAGWAILRARSRSTDGSSD